MSLSLTLTDASLTCLDCQQAFPFTVAEQQFYAERGFRRPERCADCRAARRAERNAEMLAAYDTKESARSWAESRHGFGGAARPSGPSGRGRVGGGGGMSGKPTFRAVCSSCGRDTELPFQPRPGRPVFCRECFNQRRGR